MFRTFAFPSLRPFATWDTGGRRCEIMQSRVCKMEKEMQRRKRASALPPLERAWCRREGRPLTAGSVARSLAFACMSGCKVQRCTVVCGRLLHSICIEVAGGRSSVSTSEGFGNRGGERKTVTVIPLFYSRFLMPCASGGGKPIKEVQFSAPRNRHDESVFFYDHRCSPLSIGVMDWDMHSGRCSAVSHQCKSVDRAWYNMDFTGEVWVELKLDLENPCLKI